MWVTEQLKQGEKALNSIVQQLKKQQCDVPDVKDKTCEEKCEEAKSRAKKQSELVNTKQAVVTKACGNKMRKLQVETPATTENDAKDAAKEAKKPEPKLDDCAKATKNLKGESLVLSVLNAKSDACTCEKPKPKPEPKPEPEDCDDVGKELCEIQHELVDLYNTKFGLRRLNSQRKSRKCPTRRQLQQVKSLTLNTEDPIDKKIIAVLNKIKEIQAKKDNCVNKDKRFLKMEKDF